MKKQFLLQAFGVVLALGAVQLAGVPAQAQETGSLHYYSVSPEDYRNHYYEWKNFLEYNEHREQCQNYRLPPPGYVMVGCDVYRAGSKTQTTTTIQTRRHLLPIVSSYTIYFDFNKSNVRESEKDTLDRVAREIDKYNPTQVTVSGFADRSGSADYNQKLSEKRAQSVAKALMSQGIESEVIDKEAYGEFELAVPTADGVKLQENRRVVIDFRR